MSACLGVTLAATPLAWADRITPDLRADFDAYLETALTRYDVPGAAVAVVEGGHTVYAKALGKRSRHGHGPVDNGYGMGWGVVDDLHGQRVLTHDGGTAGFASVILLVPDAQLGVVILTNNVDGGAAFHSAVANYLYQAAFGLPHEGENAIYQAYQAGHAMLAEIVAGSPPVTWAETRSYVGAYTHDVCAAFDRHAEFTLQTDFGVLPLLSLAQLGQPGLYATSRNWVGIVAQFTDDSLILGDGDATNWTVDRLTSRQPHPAVHGWRWREHVRRPVLPRPLRWSERP